MTLPEIEGFRIRRLSPADAPALQALYERCSDYHEQHEGVPTRPSAAEEELAALPPGRSVADKFSLGIFAADGEMVGYLDLVRDFPAAGEWQVGLMMMDPAARGGGIGGRVYEAAARWMAAMGARTVTLGVLEHAPDAGRFWRRMGFREVRRQPYTSETGSRQSQLIVMQQPLPRPAA